MRLGVLFSGGKDSTYACFLAKQYGHEIACLISLFSNNKDSFMFHTPAIEITRKQSELMKIPQIVFSTKGKKEDEVSDLKEAIKLAIANYKIEGIVTGAVESVYQATRIQTICNELKIECFNPLWQKNQIRLLEELLKNKFEIILTGVAAYPLDKKWIGRKIDKDFISEMKILNKKYYINPAGEGGEFESLVLSCPLFEKKLEIRKITCHGENNSWRAELKIQPTSPNGEGGELDLK